MTSIQCPSSQKKKYYTYAIHKPKRNELKKKKSTKESKNISIK